MNKDFLTFREIFNKYEIIHVPYYQRAYVWGEKNDGRNLYKFIDDIFTQFKEHPNEDYFIGTLAFCAEKTNDVIDGQQRITSIILILSILANIKCSEKIQKDNIQLIYKNNNFIINEPDYLTNELKYNLKIGEYKDPYNGEDFIVHIDKTIDKIKNQIQRTWSGYKVSWYDDLYEFILNKVTFISLEYSNIRDSLKYFLNINSLSIELTQSDIFFSILSQCLRMANSSYSIFELKQKILFLSQTYSKGFNRPIDGYKSYDDKKETDNIIYIFLNAYYSNTNYADALKEIGIGRWLSFYNNSIFNNDVEAKEFTDKFILYLNDLEFLCKYFTNDSELKLKKDSSIYTSWILLKYENYFDFNEFLIDLFTYRHNYKNNTENLYISGTLQINLEEIEEIAKRLNLTILHNYIRSTNKRLLTFIDNIKIENGFYKKTIEDIIDNISLDSIFNLNYRDDNPVSDSKIKNESRIIKVILAFQESFLNAKANNQTLLNEYLEDILLNDKFSIEHLFSVNEYNNLDRRNNWINKLGKFNDPNSFDIERFKFENLSLLDKKTNSSLQDKEINDKLGKYKNANSILNNESEYLIMSFVENSDFYSNKNLKLLNLPKRTIKNINSNTWEQNENNRDFNTELLKLALKYVANLK